ncbi:MAG TPA: ATP-binding protein [Thermoleophilaceae bacterium]
MKLPRPTVRVRLTALYALLFGASAALLLGLSWWLVGRQLHRTLPDGFAHDALSDLGLQYVLAFAGTLIVAVALGWVVAGRVLSPLSRMTRTARRVSEQHLDERIGLSGPHDELRELADTLDSMLDRLSESFEAQRRFAANVSHELRSPLTVIRAEAEVALANPEPDPEELREMAEAVVAATERTEALLDGLLVLARSERGMLHREPLELSEVARDAIRAVEDEAGPAGVRLELRPDRARTRGDRRLIERLIANLVENGVRHNHPGGWARVEVWAADGAARLRVENSGPDLDRAAASQLAEPFKRLDRRDGRGAGLGLSIVRSVSEAHGGELWIAPRRGGGLTVEVALPREG